MGSYNRDNRGGRRSFGGGGRSFGGGGRGFDRGGGDRPMYSAICSNCGKECQIPFRPTQGKPVYCSDCFEKMGGRRSDSPRPERGDFRPQPPVSNNNTQLEALNAKLDRIIGLLEPKVEAPVVVEAPVSEPVVEKIKIPKAKKVASKKK